MKNLAINLQPLLYGDFPICRNYTVWAQLRLTAFGKHAPLKQIQEWLGHSDNGTTVNIYSHLDYKSKITSANVMDNILTLPDTRQTGWHA